jgi:hypothetical protein
VKLNGTTLASTCLTKDSVGESARMCSRPRGEESESARARDLEKV